MKMWKAVQEFGARCVEKVRGFVSRVEVKAAAAVGGTVAASGAHATDAYTSIVTAVDWSAVETDVVTIFAAVMGVVVIIRGGRMLISAAKR